MKTPFQSESVVWSRTTGAGDLKRDDDLLLRFKRSSQGMPEQMPLTMAVK